MLERQILLPVGEGRTCEHVEIRLSMGNQNMQVEGLSMKCYVLARYVTNCLLNFLRINVEKES